MMSLSVLEQKKKLIDIVELIPDLWRPTKKKPHFKQKLWNDVGVKLGTSGLNARRQWRILRDQFRREYKRFTYDSNYKSTWIFYNRMLFMRHFLRARDGHTNSCTCRSISDNDEHDLEEQKSVNMNVSQMVEQNCGNIPKIQVRQDLQGSTTSTDSLQSQDTICANVDGEPSTSAGVSSSCERPGYDGNLIEFSSTRRRIHPESTEDEDYHFVMSILPSLRSIQRTKKLRVRSKILELIATELDADFEFENQLHLSLHNELMTDSDTDDKFLPGILLNQMQ